MQLSLTVLRCPDKVAPEARMVPGGEFHVGRGPDVDWVLPDPDRLLSKRHFAVAFRGGSWQVADTSTNGTYLNADSDSIGRGATRSLCDGDRLRLGAYEIEVRLVEQPSQGEALGQAPGPGPQSPGPQSLGPQSLGPQSLGPQSLGQREGDPFGDPFDEDPLAPDHAARPPFGEAAYPDQGLAHGAAQLPADFDPPGFDQMTPGRDDPAFGGGFRGAVQSDHSSSMEDAMMPPMVEGYAAPQAGGIIPADDLLPDDWDKDLLEGIAPPQPASAPSRNPDPLARNPGPLAAPPGAAPPGTAPPGTAPLGAAIGAPPAQADEAVPVPVSAPIVRQRPAPDLPAAAALSPFDEPSDLAVPAPAVPSGTAATTPSGMTDALAAFFKGAELSGATPADPIAMMTNLGEAFRAMVEGLRAVLIARATIKSEFRIDQTMLRARGNNPLKFSANDDDALTALLGVGRRTDMTPAEAIDDSLHDLRMHEVAVVAAMQVAVRAVLNELSPDKIRDGAEQGGLNVLPAQRKARAWDAFEARHAAVTQALADDFDSIFGKAFAQAYERALDEISKREQQ